MNKKFTITTIILLSVFIFFPYVLFSQIKSTTITPGVKWVDNESVAINAHGGGVLFHNNAYYWFGEHKGITGNALVGIRCYSSPDLYNWKNEGVALAVSKQAGSDIESNCKMERPKVIYNKKTGKFVMYFHLELKDKGYDAARVGIAVADEPAGPYVYQRSLRPNAEKWPIGCSSEQDAIQIYFNQYLIRDFKGGQLSRDMNLFVDDDEKAYHIFSSEGNATLHIAELSDDYLSHTGVFSRMAPGGYNEAPAIFKREGRYYMITSGCTGWAPNAARLFTTTNILGTWTEFPNPCVGNNAELTFNSQSTFVLPVSGKKNAFVYMGDRWNKDNLQNSLYVWLPVQFKNGLPVLQWVSEWNTDSFSNTYGRLRNDIASGKEFLAQIKIGEGIGEYSQEVATVFEKSIEAAEKIAETAIAEEIETAILTLSNAAADLQEARRPREMNTLDEGDYYIKVNNKYYLTNSADILWDKSLPLKEKKSDNINEQIFNIAKHPLTGRYKIVSKLDGRNVNEGCRIRHDWGANDHLWRTMNIHYSGNGYAIQTDGKAFGVQWRVDEATLLIKPKEPYRPSVQNEDDFIFSIEKVPNGSALVNASKESQWDLFASRQAIDIHTNKKVGMSIYASNGLLVKQFVVDRDTRFPFSSGIYMVHIESECDSQMRKIIVE